MSGLLARIGEDGEGVELGSEVCALQRDLSAATQVRPCLHLEPRCLSKPWGTPPLLTQRPEKRNRHQAQEAFNAIPIHASPQPVIGERGSSGCEGGEALLLAMKPWWPRCSFLLLAAWAWAWVWLGVICTFFFFFGGGGGGVGAWTCEAFRRW